MTKGNTDFSHKMGKISSEKKSDKPGKTWCFTINNYTAEDTKLLENIECSYIVYGIEVGESGTPHYQGCVTFRQTYRLSGLKKLHKTAHWEKAIAKDAAINYCMKDGEYTIRDNRAPGARNDITDFVSTLRQDGMRLAALSCPQVFIKYSSGCMRFASLLNEPRTSPPVVKWLWGATGAGKTHYVYEREKKDLWISGRNLEWFDGYTGQKAVLFDDFRGDFCTMHYLLRLLDVYPLLVPFKGGFVDWSPERIYITAPHPPDHIYPNSFENIGQLHRRIHETIQMVDKEIYDVQTNEV